MSEQPWLMVFCPKDGSLKPYPSQAAQWREYHGQVAWLVNPYTGEERTAEDIGTDTFGHLIVIPPSVRQQ